MPLRLLYFKDDITKFVADCWSWLKNRDIPVSD
jgi:hypothetical protein